MSEKCCEWHDALPEIVEAGATPEWDECGLAGKGRPYVCCVNCPDLTPRLLRAAPHYVGHEVEALTQELRDEGEV
jgi:hypothetical protein